MVQRLNFVFVNCFVQYQGSSVQLDKLMNFGSTSVSNESICVRQERRRHSKNARLFDSAYSLVL